MKSDFLISNKDNFFDIFADLIENSVSFDWAVAFANHKAFEKLQSSFDVFFKKGGYSRAVFDITACLTEPEIIEEFLTIPGESFCRIWAGDNKKTLFHHKFYLFEKRDLSHESLIIGSPNFTYNGLSSNFESAIHLTGSKNEDIFRRLHRSFDEDIWANPYLVSPDSDEEILKKYKEIFSEQKKKSFAKIDVGLSKLRKIIQSTASIDLDSKYGSPKLAFLIGLLCASANKLKRNDINKRLLKLTFRGQTLNTGTEHEGYVCTSIDNILLGGIKLPQRKTQVDTVKRLSSEINDFLKLDDAKISVNFQDNSKKMTICEINISFTKESKVWKVMKACINEFILDGEHFIPVVPSKILNATNITLKRDFLRGYFGFRSRISKSDRYPNGKLRLALQIDTGAQKFADQIKEILTKDFKIQAQLNDGSARDRDNMIRMIPTQSASNLYSKGWMRLLISEFIKFNKQLDK